VREADLKGHLGDANKPGSGGPTQGSSGGSTQTERRSGEDSAAAERGKSLTAEQINERLRNRKPVVFGSPEDWQLQQAMNHLKGRPVAKPASTQTAAARSDRIVD
jgi:carboxyl-terminal processing protease